ncbi:hypothetical protein [Enterococcus gallinarum]|uniref:hypothetical protein n=1 Tax=Enterococcus gallinarum TaxID=1353 RepID=UPI001CAA5F8A|nr:hypothetical protein [Enterococcus gallinarum]
MSNVDLNVFLSCLVALSVVLFLVFIIFQSLQQTLNFMRINKTLKNADLIADKQLFKQFEVLNHFEEIQLKQADFKDDTTVAIQDKDSIIFDTYYLANISSDNSLKWIYLVVHEYCHYITKRNQISFKNIDLGLSPKDISTARSKGFDLKSEIMTDYMTYKVFINYLDKNMTEQQFVDLQTYINVEQLQKLCKDSVLNKYLIKNMFYI